MRERAKGAGELKSPEYFPDRILSAWNRSKTRKQAITARGRPGRKPSALHEKPRAPRGRQPYFADDWNVPGLNPGRVKDRDGVSIFHVSPFMGNVTLKDRRMAEKWPRGRNPGARTAASGIPLARQSSALADSLARPDAERLDKRQGLYEPLVDAERYFHGYIRKKENRLFLRLVAQRLPGEHLVACRGAGAEPERSALSRFRELEPFTERDGCCMSGIAIAAMAADEQAVLDCMAGPG